MFDSQGNVWVGNNFLVKARQTKRYLWDGNLTKFAPNGSALSPMTTGFSGGGLSGVGFGLAIDEKDNAWVYGYASLNITREMQGNHRHQNRRRLGSDQGKNQLVHLPGGDPAKAEIYCQNASRDPLKNPCGPVPSGDRSAGPHLDQQRRGYRPKAIDSGAKSGRPSTASMKPFRNRNVNAKRSPHAGAPQHRLVDPLRRFRSDQGRETSTWATAAAALRSCDRQPQKRPARGSLRLLGDRAPQARFTNSPALASAPLHVPSLADGLGQIDANDVEERTRPAGEGSQLLSLFLARATPAANRWRGCQSSPRFRSGVR